jgi:hypothetical protein
MKVYCLKSKYAFASVFWVSIISLVITLISHSLSLTHKQTNTQRSKYQGRSRAGQQVPQMAEEKESTSIPLSQAENGGEDPAKSPPGSPNSSTRKVRLFFNLHRPNTLFHFQLYADPLDPGSANNFAFFVTS